MDRPQQLSGAAAFSFLSLPPWFSISQQASMERQDRHGLGDTETEILSFDLLLWLPEGETSHGHRHYVGAGLHTGETLDRIPIRFPMSSTLTSLNKLTNATCDFLETAKVWAF